VFELKIRIYVTSKNGFRIVKDFPTYSCIRVSLLVKAAQELQTAVLKSHWSYRLFFLSFLAGVHRLSRGFLKLFVALIHL
jgi:hypothetical protein